MVTDLLQQQFSQRGANSKGQRPPQAKAITGRRALQVNVRATGVETSFPNPKMSDCMKTAQEVVLKKLVLWGGTGLCDVAPSSWHPSSS
jgi:hypothetical protein